jgi:hypothetical protein
MMQATPYIVAIWILDEGQRIIGDLIDKLDALMFRRMVDAPLQNATSMAVCRYLNAVSSHGIINELLKEQHVSND